METATLTLNESQRHRVWEGLISSQVHADYFAEWSNRYYTRQRWATLAALFFSSGAFVTVLTDWGHLWIRSALSLIVALLSGYSLVAQNQKMAMDGSDLFVRWNKLGQAYHALWENMYDANALDRLNTLDEERILLSKSATQFPNDPKRLDQIQSETEERLRRALSA